MRIGMYVHWAGVGGAEDMALDQIKYSRDKVEYIFATERQSGWGPTHDEMQDMGVPVHQVEGNLISNYRQLWANNRVDLVHVFACGDTLEGYQAALDMQLPVVETAACLAYSHGYEVAPSLVYPVYLCNKHWVHGSNGKKEFKVITGGVDIERLGDQSAAKKRDYKLKMGFNPDQPLVGWFGRFDQFKCPFSFVDIAKFVMTEIPNCQFAMFGNGVDYGRTIYLSTEKHVPIQFRGAVRDKGSAFGCMDVYCFPTWQEAFGRVMVEAMACGVPVVTSDHPVCQEVCGQAALYAPTVRTDPMPLPNAKMFADKIVQVLKESETASVMGTLGWQRARTLYDARRMADEYVQFYQDILAGRGRSE